VGRPVSDPERPERPVDDDPELIVRDWYDNHYSQVSATADGSFFSTYMHRAMEHRFDEHDSFDRVLEVGGNRGEHVAFVRHRFSDYLLTDLYPPKLIPALAADPRIRTEVCDVSDIPEPSGSFDRVIATCLLHHVDSPFKAAQEMRRVAAAGGNITILVPTDPGLAYRAGKALTSGREARRAGLGERHRLLGALDHPNHFSSIKEQLRHVFRDDRLSIDWRPWRVPSLSLNAFTVFTVTKSASERGSGRA
jgi:phosphatidylethanolamine/phosphatidyl-N-methylethanolamine N-methyltransferase